MLVLVLLGMMAGRHLLRADRREGHRELAHRRAGGVQRKPKYAAPLGALGAAAMTVGVGIFVVGVLQAL
jgi:hypothetical protein